MSTTRTTLQPEQKWKLDAGVKAIGTLHDRYAAAYYSHDAAAAAAFFADAAVLMLPDQPDIEGRQAIQVMVEHDYGRNAAKIKHIPLETQLAGYRAYKCGNITTSVTAIIGKPIEKSVKCLVILKRQLDGSWKTCLDMFNSNLKENTERLAEVIEHRLNMAKKRWERRMKCRPI